MKGLKISTGNSAVVNVHNKQHACTIEERRNTIFPDGQGNLHLQYPPKPNPIKANRVPRLIRMVFIANKYFIDNKLH